MPPPKSSSTCTQCRARKVRCEGGPDHCSNCQRLNFACSFANLSSTSILQSLSRPERRRGSRACLQCRAQKAKCSGELPCCATCRSRGRDGECTYPEVKRPARLAPRPAAANSSGNTNRGASSSVSPVAQQLPQQQPFHQSSPSQPSVLEAPNVALALSSPTGVSVTTAAMNSHSQPVRPSVPSDPGNRSSVSGLYASPSSCASVSHSLPPIRDQLRLINDYFRHLHPIPTYSFLNEVSTTLRCLEGTLDDALLLSLCAVTALHFRYAKYYPASTSVWIQRAEDLIWSRIEKPSILRAQALVLVVQYRIESGSFQKAYMLLSLAARSASAMRLQYERLDLGPMAQEIRRRVMWSLMLLDGHFSVGLPEMEVCPHDSIYIKLPCKEEEFHADDDGTGELGSGGVGLSVNNHHSLSLDGVAENGLLSINLRVAVVRRDICKLMRQVRICGHPMPEIVHIVDNVVQLLEQLDVPQYSPQELERYSTSPWLPRYLTALCSWHQSHCDLYRLFLTGYKEAAPAIVVSTCPRSYAVDAVRRCYQHANANISILLDLVELRSTSIKVVDNDVAICGYHACRLILYISRYAHSWSSDPRPQELDQEQHQPQENFFMSPVEASAKATKVLALLRRLFSQSILLEQLLRDLETIIQSHNNGESTEPRRSSSDGEDNALDTQPPRYAAAVQRHRSLGVHSILRQARFHDDESAESTDSDVDILRRQNRSDISLDHDTGTTASRQGFRPDETMGLNSSLNSISAPPQVSSLTLGMASNWPLLQTQIQPQVAANSGDNGGSSNSNNDEELGLDFTILPDDLDLAHGGMWNDWSWDHFFSPTSDMDTV